MADFVKSVEYVETTLSTAGPTSTNLGKSQNHANCVPFFSINGDSSIDDPLERRYVNLLFESGPKITAQRDVATGTIIIGQHVVEIDTDGDVSVQQGTWSMTGATATAAITDVVDTAKAFVIISYRHDSAVVDFDAASVSVVFNSSTELGFTRIATDGTITGNYYIVWTTGTDFSVQHTSIAFGDFDETKTATISAVTLASSFVISNQTVDHTSNDIFEGHVIVDISSTTTVRGRRAFDDFGDTTADAAAQLGADVETQVVSAGGSEFSVERAECNWGNSLTKAVTVTEIDQAEAIVVAGGYMGEMSSAESAGNDFAGNLATMKFTSDTEVTGTRAQNTSPDGTTMFEVVEFGLVAAAALPDLVMAPYIPA